MKKLVFNPFTGGFDLIQDISGISTNASDITDLQNNKVDKVVGKELSDENYTLTEKNKLSGIESGAEVNIPETITNLSITGNTLTYVNENGTNQDIDLSLYLDDTNLARIISGEYVAGDNVLRFTRDDGSTFDIDASMFFDDTNIVTSVNIQTGDVVLDADNINDTTTAHKFTSQSDIDRLANTSGTNTGDQDISGIGVNASDITDLQNNKVDKVAGKGLSDENYTLSEKDKLSGIESGAEVNTVDSVNTQTGDVVLPVLEGTQYIYVQANGTDTENATELQDAYTTAQGMSPTSTNRITVICGVGNYDFGTSSFDMDTQYIDLVSLDGNRSVIFNHTLSTSNRTEGSINITANNVFVKGIDVGTKNFTIADNLNLLKVENCKGGVFSFGYNAIVSGTFTNCVGGGASFGNEGTASGTFTNCVGGNSSFARFGTASGTFTNCEGGVFSFGTDGTASGTFTDCVGGDDSFGSFGTASGTFNNCVGGSSSFGLFGTLNGKLYYCRLTAGTFETVATGGVTRLCIDGSNNENNQG